MLLSHAVLKFREIALAVGGTSEFAFGVRNGNREFYESLDDPQDELTASTVWFLCPGLEQRFWGRPDDPDQAAVDAIGGIQSLYSPRQPAIEWSSDGLAFPFGVLRETMAVLAKIAADFAPLSPRCTPTVDRTTGVPVELAIRVAVSQESLFVEVLVRFLAVRAEFDRGDFDGQGNLVVRSRAESAEQAFEACVNRLRELFKHCLVC